MTSRHLIAGLDTTLNRQIDLYDLENARLQIVATGELVFLTLVTLFKLSILLFKQFMSRSQLIIELSIAQLKLEPLLTL